jgi:ATP-dependent RNA helicase DHX57
MRTLLVGTADDKLASISSIMNRGSGKISKLQSEQQLYQTIVQLIWYIVEMQDFEHRTSTRGSETRGSVLVFLAGMKEITQVMELLDKHEQPSSKLLVLPLHSSVAIEQQQRVFDRAPAGVTKVVLSTNIAETSVTIDDVVYVIESGKQNRMAYDSSTRTSRLEQCDIARSSAKQRIGRAGRVRQGVAYCLYTKHHHDNSMRQSELAEIHCTPLHQLYLHAKALIEPHRIDSDVATLSKQQVREMDAAVFLSEAIEPPSTDLIHDAETFLLHIGALTHGQQHRQAHHHHNHPNAQQRVLHLTALGHHLAALPIDVQLGKMLLYAAVLRCLPQALTIAAFLSSQSPFVAPLEQRAAANAAHRTFVAARSDHFRYLSVYAAFEAAGTQRKQRQFCSQVSARERARER